MAALQVKTMDQSFDLALHAHKGLLELVAFGAEHLLPEPLFQPPACAARNRLF